MTTLESSEWRSVLILMDKEMGEFFALELLLWNDEIVGDATTWSVTFDHNFENSRGVIQDYNIFVIQATS
jgi:hypothetical protein